MIGYYVHHHGRGHLHRATTLGRRLVERGESVAGLSSLPRPPDWPGEWVDLPRDDEGGRPFDPTASGRLHWVPQHDRGLRDRMALVSSFLDERQPRLVVVDVSVEIAVLVRLHGVPVVGVVQPGVRDDAAHALGFDIADELVGFWPSNASTMLRGVDETVRARVKPLGALSRFAVAPMGEVHPGTVALLSGAGGSAVTVDEVVAARAATPSWCWRILGGPAGAWVEDPLPELANAQVVVTHAGQNALAEVAAARRPAVVLPQARPYDEQVTTAAVLEAHDLPVVVAPGWPNDWSRVLDEAADRDGALWAGWNDGLAADRFVDVIESVR